jgi:hypothetical protein
VRILDASLPTQQSMAAEEAWQDWPAAVLMIVLAQVWAAPVTNQPLPRLAPVSAWPLALMLLKPGEQGEVAMRDARTRKIRSVLTEKPKIDRENQRQWQQTKMRQVPSLV